MTELRASSLREMSVAHAWAEGRAVRTQGRVERLRPRIAREGSARFRDDADHALVGIRDPRFCGVQTLVCAAASGV